MGDSGIIMLLLVAIGVFLLAREVMLWYWKITEMIKLLRILVEQNAVQIKQNAEQISRSDTQLQLLEHLRYYAALPQGKSTNVSP